MRISLNATNHAWPGAPDSLRHELTRVVRAADDAGLDTVWVADHLLQVDPRSSLDAEVLEAYTTLGFLAARTTRVRLGTMVTGVTFRPPGLLVKAVTTLDVLSGGRAWLGLGAGYHNDEARAMGLPMPAAAERFERLEETLRIAHRMWSGDDTAFRGRHYQLRRPVGRPLPITRPRPPVLVGGMGEQRTLPLVARYADACNLFDVGDGGLTVRRKLDVLAEHCTAVGRPREEIETTLSTRLEPGEHPDSFILRCADLATLGVEHIVVITEGPWTEQGVATLARAVDALGGDPE
ncbi:LLM class F420-dependent oxidoreductase [Nocardiopsis halotolerans]|uniref:LLM class F420-dependent oxidoreductase n=1 Tax=Nocardiopsis halotolerans TaxID=124252 RepID=UPI00034A1A4C|nr:LLM class F420-dependent oxidoreductase [Nocardiopsis halotolerans]